MNRHDRSNRARRLLHDALPPECGTAGASWIAGRWKAGTNLFHTIDPATGDALHPVAQASVADVAEAAEAAAAAGRIWWSMDGQDRAQILWRIAAGIRSRSKQLGLLDTLDAGRPIRDTQTRDPDRAARIFEYFAGVTDRIRGAAVPVQPGLRNLTVMEPHGVVGAIIPWNYPLTNAATKLAPALATGNAVILKPAEDTPLSAMLLAEITKEAGLPDGVLNVVQGGGDVGRAVVDHPLVSKIAFTGSTEVGRQIAQSAGGSLKSVTLELGGKSAFIVFEDADLKEAASALVFSLLNNQGQTCTAATRLLAPTRLADALLDRVAAMAATIRVGDPLDPSTHVGPLISKTQLERISAYAGLGRQEGAEPILLRMDRRIDGLGGFFPDPIVFRGVSPQMRIHREEIFGPILVMLTFEDEEEAIALANGTDYGLSSSIWTNDLRRAERMSARMESGLVWVNTIHSLHPGSPYGGFRQSGIGSEMGTEAVSQFMKTKSIWTAVEPYRSPW